MLRELRRPWLLNDDRRGPCGRTDQVERYLKRDVCGPGDGPGPPGPDDAGHGVQSNANRCADALPFLAAGDWIDRRVPPSRHRASCLRPARSLCQPRRLVAVVVMALAPG